MSDDIAKLLTQEGFALLKRKRDETIEECAQEALRYPFSSIERIADAIRALKDRRP